MKFKEADKKLAELFPGKHRTIEYSLTTHSDGEIKQECSVYVDGKSWVYGSTFQEAIDKLCGNYKEEEPQDIDDTPEAA